MAAPASLTVVRQPPRAPSAGGRAPVLVLLHGVGSHERDLLPLAETLDARLDVRSLRAPLAMGPGAWGWFHVTFTPSGPQHDAPEAEAARAAVVAWLRALREEPGVDPERIYLLGFSQGAIVSLSVALTEPALVAGVVAIAGRTLQEIQARVREHPPVDAPPVLLLHGRQDAKLPFTHATTSAAVLAAAGVPHELRAFDAGHTITGVMRDDVARWLSSALDGTAR